MKTNLVLLVSLISLVFLADTQAGRSQDQLKRDLTRSKTERPQEASERRGLLSFLSNGADNRIRRSRTRKFQPSLAFISKSQTVRTTAYTHSESDHIVYGRKTAIGTTLKSSKSYTSAAADWSRFPLGTTFRIAGDTTTYVVDDYGSALVGTNTIDLYKPSRASMNRWGARYVDITIIKKGDPQTSKEILEDRLGYWHCRQMYRDLKRII